VNKVYERIAEEAIKAGLKVRLLGAIPDEHPKTLKSVLIALDGESSEFINSWIGTVQWIGTSPFRPHHKRRNWFVKIEMICEPKIPLWREEDIKVESMLATGPGGQHLNKTESAVRVTHVPTRTTVVAREERSQYLNRKLALARLGQRLERVTEKIMDSAQRERWTGHNSLERGNPVRIFMGPEFKLKSET
jgi:peptide chain release factor